MHKALPIIGRSRSLSSLPIPPLPFDEQREAFPGKTLLQAEQLYSRLLATLRCAVENRVMMCLIHTPAPACVHHTRTAYTPIPPSLHTQTFTPTTATLNNPIIP